MNAAAIGAIALALLPAGAADVQSGDAGAPAVTRPIREVMSDAIGIFCVPVLIAGKLPSDDLISRSHFTRGTPIPPDRLSEPSFEFRVDGGAVVEVFADEPGHACTIHVHGAAS